MLSINLKTNGKNKKQLCSSNELYNFISGKVEYLKELIQNTIISIERQKNNDIFSNNDTNLSISILIEISNSIKEISKPLFAQRDNRIFETEKTKVLDNLLELLQKQIEKLSMVICGFGTFYIDDLLFVCFGNEFQNMKFENKLMEDKYELLRKNIRPVGYKIVAWNNNKLPIRKCEGSQICENKIVDDIILPEDSPILECFDMPINIKSFYNRTHGIRIVIQNEKQKKTLIINGIVEEIPLDCFVNTYINERRSQLKKISDKYGQTERDIINKLIDTITIKDILIYGNEDIEKKMVGVMVEADMVRQNKLENTIKKFLELEISCQRKMIINLLMYSKDPEIQYTCYILYDLITTTDGDSFVGKMNIYDSLPWKIKQYFKETVKQTIKYTNDLNNKYDYQKITLEQQIHLMKTSDYIKEKAMSKLKELKGRPDESGLKTKQYLEGLVKIPFGIYKEEPILKRVKENNKWFLRLLSLISHFFPELTKSIEKKEKYTNNEMYNFIVNLEEFVAKNVVNIIKNKCEHQTNKQITNAVQYINSQKKTKKIIVSNQARTFHIEKIMDFLKSFPEFLMSMYDKIDIENPISLNKTMNDIATLRTNTTQIEKVIENIQGILDQSIYSHVHAKKQIMKIIGQWMNGEQTGYCFGFEGSPGVGKTSLAKKGLSNCLLDDNGISRPFSFIALGGSSTGSMIEGHGYTYTNSTWGKIVDILMETKCMNPIIYIDELDKISKTESGKEIISIFTHILDSTQNDVFQDKYFSGINLDLSKALFIFSYNDPEQIDKVLLDRIHRIKFENLRTDEKIVIVNKFLLPELNEKMGFENIVNLTAEIIEYIIETYTLEPGIRKLKEILFDIYGEINLELLECSRELEKIVPIKITRENLETRYLSKYKKTNKKTIHATNEIGIINGLWANGMGQGGIIPIQTMFFPTQNFLELKLTGLQGDTMKESMNVAKSLAWNMTDEETKTELLLKFDKTKCQGVHIHCPEGGISKDGPSAGVAITCAIYSLLNQLEIKNDIAITGEICLNGEVAAIGGLDNKINGAIRAGIKTILYPKKNSIEFEDWKRNNKTNDESIIFIEISTIQDAFEKVFENSLK